MVGARIKELRTARGLTQLGLAEAAGLDKMAVSRIERGEREPLFSTLRALARSLDVEPGELFLPPSTVQEVQIGRPPNVAAEKPPAKKPKKGK